MPIGHIPSDLCPAHWEIALKWKNNHYDRHDPSEWPGGMSTTFRTLLMDFRTSHKERAQQFEEKNEQQINATIRTCRSGRSPQCTPRTAAEAA